MKEQAEIKSTRFPFQFSVVFFSSFWKFYLFIFYLCLMLKNVLALTIDVESSDDVRVYNFYIHYNNNKKHIYYFNSKHFIPIVFDRDQQKDRSNSLFNTRKTFLEPFWARCDVIVILNHFMVNLSRVGTLMRSLKYDFENASMEST